jgi:tetratricopeptide (TPR) repeat protein
MIDSPSRGALARAAGFAAALSLACAAMAGSPPEAVAGDAGAGVGAPVKLAPPKPLPELLPDDYGKIKPQAGPSAAAPPSAPAGPPEALSPAAPAATAQPPAEAEPKVPPPTVEVDQLQALDPDSVGVLGEDAGGLGIGMWDGTPRALVERLIPALPAKTTWRAARDVMRRLLLSVATAPRGPRDKSLVVLRAEELRAMGDAKGMKQLLDAAPGRSGDEQFARLRVDSLLLSGDTGQACDKIAAAVRDYPNGFWQRALVFCQIRAGKKEQARLGLALLRETGAGKDQAFPYLAAILLGEKPKDTISPMSVSALEIAMLHQTGPGLPESLAKSDDPAVLSAVATAPDSDVAVRLAAAERAEAAGSVSPDVVADLYSSVSFTADELANALTTAEKEGGPRGRALLYQAMGQQQVAAGRAEALQAALRLARKDGRLPTMARVALPTLLQIEPNASLAWFAADAGRALLLAGKRDQALAWYDAVAGSHDPEARRAEMALAPLVLLAGGDEGTGDDALLQEWLDEMAKGGPDLAAATPQAGGAPSNPTTKAPDAAPADAPPPGQSRDQAELVLGLLDGLGVHVSNAELGPFVTAGRATTVMPGAALWTALHTAVREGRRGEAVLLALVALGDGDLRATDPIVVDAVVGAFSYVGLTDAARNLAVEAAVAHGL